MAPIAEVPLLVTDFMNERVDDGTFVPNPIRPSPPRRINALAMSAEAMVVVEFKRSVELNVEEARTKIPAVVEVGVSVGCPGKAMCQDPGEPDEPPPQAEPVPETRPLVSA